MEQLLIAIAAWCAVNSASPNGLSFPKDLFNQKLACQKELLTCVIDEARSGSHKGEHTIVKKCFLAIKELK